ncbi:hypothetical protein FDA94_21855 [Herbidospora galbida]|uniref:Pycsar effector protein domain-containing protein n=1 Tax=Herbidospora galbida TaxID=2575442 RepID=A0A4U3MDJ0_9ACTN|nr:hypothetical protein [Herbidospora galbida]TKK86462.1 hypothetical protein FDA94_21855 [Herbidospora galbida]
MQKHTSASELESLELVMWMINRYDLLRSSTASRATLLVSANTFLLTGTALLLTVYGNARPNEPSWLSIAFIGFFFATISAILASIWDCVSAIAAQKTSRSVTPSAIPSRFAFNWGDTLKEVSTFSDFSTRLTEANLQDKLGFAVSELWTAINQHKRKHRHLRRGVRLFRISLLLFLILTTFSLIRRFIS